VCRASSAIVDDNDEKNGMVSLCVCRASTDILDCDEESEQDGHISEQCGGTLVCVQGVFGHRGLRRGEEQDGELVRVQGVDRHLGLRRGERAGLQHQRAVREHANVCAGSRLPSWTVTRRQTGSCASACAEGVSGHRGRQRGERAGRQHQRAVRGQHTGQVVWHCEC
jgi:hypothetical protein